MKHFVPYFIQKQHHENTSHGDFQAVAIFVDISGFTRLTGTLMKFRKDGAEVLTDVLNAIFEPLIDEIQQHGGMISTFAGDGFTALFPTNQSDALPNAIQCAFRIREFFEAHRVMQTKYGSFKIGVKIGIARGGVEWGILGEADMLTYFFRGDAINGCAHAEQAAKRGEIIADSTLKSFLEKVCKFDIRDNYLSLTEHLDARSPSSVRRQLLPEEFSHPFVRDDIRSLTARAEFRSACTIFISFPEHLEHKTLSAFTARTMALANTHGGYFNKVDFGDKGGVFLILFGAPVTHENDVERAFNFILALRREWSDISWRAGVTLGSVYAGIIGADTRCEYTAIGMSVNLAARLMMKADYGAILSDRLCARKSGGQFETELVGHFGLKGFSGMQPIFQLKGRSAVVRDRQYEGRMVGRDDELHQLLEWARPIMQGQFAGLTYIHGEPGMGKSRLVYEFKQHLAEEAESSGKGFYWFFCPVDQILRQPLNPFIYFLHHYFQISSEHSVTENQASFDQIYDNLIAKTRQLARTNELDVRLNNLVRELERTRSVLAAQVGLFQSDSLWEQLDPKGKYENTLSALKTLFLAESLRKPIVLELEDMHWLDQDSIVFLQTLARHIRSEAAGSETADSLTDQFGHFPIFIVATLRYHDDGQKHAFDLHGIPVHEIDLGYLSEKGVADCAEDQLGGTASQRLHDLLIERTRGNPFFVRQMLAYLNENDQLDFQDGTFDLRDEAALRSDIPATINAILMARLDRLAQQVKEVVKTASVIGREFEVKLLSAILKHDVMTPVRIAANGQIWSELQEMQFIFTHTLLRDAAYEMQLRARLRELHKLTAESIVQLYQGNLERKYADLAHHYEQAGLMTETRFYLSKAGDFARENFQNDKALAFYTHLLQLYHPEFVALSELEGVSGSTLPETPRLDKLLTDLPETDRREVVNVLLHKGDVLSLVGEWESGLNVLKGALIVARNVDDPALIGECQRSLGDLLRKRSDYEGAGVFLDGARASFASVGDQVGICRVTGNLGSLYFFRGAYEEAMTCYADQLHIAETLHNTGEMIAALGNMGVVHHKKGSLDAAVSCYERKLALAESVSDRQGVCSVLGNMGIIHQERGHFEQALSFYERGLAVAEELGDRYVIQMMVGNMGTLWNGQGRFERALACYKRKLQIVEEMGDLHELSVAVGNLGNVHKKLGHFSEAKACYDHQLSVSEQLGNRQVTGVAHFSMGNIFNDWGHYEQAIVSYEKMLNIAEAISQPVYACLALASLGVSYWKNGQYNSALNYFEQGIARSTEIGFHMTWAGCLIDRAHVLFELTRYDEARQTTEQGLEIALRANIKDRIFSGNLLLAKLKAVTGAVSEAVEQIQSLLDTTQNEPELAAAQATLFDLARTYPLLALDPEVYRQKALDLYRQCFSKAPLREYEVQIEHLEKTNLNTPVAQL